MANDPDVLWRVDAFGAESHPAGDRYHWESRHRQPPDQVTIQSVIAGCIHVRRPDGTIAVANAGEAFLFRHDEDSAYFLPPGNRLPYITRWINLRGCGLSQHWDLIRARLGWTVAMPPLQARFDRVFDLAQPAARTPVTTMSAAVHDLVLLLVDLGLEARRAASSPVDRAIDAIIAAPSTPWSLKEVADEHGVSREHLTRAFAARMGLPPAAWLAREREARALVLLRESTMPVAEIARMCGMGSAHTLARRIRQSTGRSPRRNR